MTLPTSPAIDELLAQYRLMALIRRFEETASTLYRNGEIPGFLHLSIGQEASAVGACWALKKSDVITSTHRGHGHCLAKGLAPAEMFAELMGREGGTNRGRGGSMHIADPSRGILGANGIVGAGLPIAVGAGTAALLRGDSSVVVAFFGDGAVSQGAFHESVNLACLWRLPIIFFCENNHFAEFSAAKDQHPVGLEARAAGYGVAYVHVDGNDVVDVTTRMRDVVDAVRSGQGPYIVESETHRLKGHYEGDPQHYRDPETDAFWSSRDPLAAARARLVAHGVAEEVLSEAERSVEAEISAAVDQARRSPRPRPETATWFVAAERPVRREEAASVSDGVETFRTMDAVRWALEQELESDPAVFFAGVDVGKGGNVFALSRGLHARWPERVRDTPISETAVMGLAVGAAMCGMRPIVELMYLDFIGVCFDQLLNQAAKLRLMTGGRAPMALTVRTQFGAGRSSGAQHSQSLEALLAHVPGLTVVMPSTPADTYGLLRASIQDPNPVIFIENRLLYGAKGPKPPVDHIVPLGRAAVVRPGRDVTVVSWSRMVHDVLAVADKLARSGIEAEVIDLRTISPWDRTTVLESVARTSHLVIVHEAVTDFGVGAEIAATVARDAFQHLDAPIERVGAAFSPAPYSPELEAAWLPDQHRIEAAIRATVTN